MLTQLLTRPCQVVRRTESATTDDYGNEIPNEMVAVSTCELQQQQRTEPTGEISSTRWLLLVATDVGDLRTDDVIVVDDATYELVGDPWPVWNPRTGAISHFEATVTRTAGAEDYS